MRKFSITLALCIFCFITQNIYSHEYFPDHLIYQGDTIVISINPLEDLFKLHPEDHEIGKLAMWRSEDFGKGYSGFWEVRNDSLFLVKVEFWDLGISQEQIFGHSILEKPGFAYWYNAALYYPQGKSLTDSIQDWDRGPIYESEIKFEFNQGILSYTRVVQNPPPRMSPYSQDHRMCSKFIQRNINYSIFEENLQRQLVGIRIEYLTEEGKIDSASIAMGSDEKRSAEALRVVKLIPQWDVIYRHGKQYQQKDIIYVPFQKVQLLSPKP